MNYQSISEVECPQCTWKMKIDSDIWTQFPDQHEEIKEYLIARVERHNSSHNPLYKNIYIDQVIASSKNSEYFIVPDSIDVDK